MSTYSLLSDNSYTSELTDRIHRTRNQDVKRVSDYRIPDFKVGFEFEGLFNYDDGVDLLPEWLENNKELWGATSDSSIQEACPDCGDYDCEDGNCCEEDVEEEREIEVDNEHTGGYEIVIANCSYTITYGRGRQDADERGLEIVTAPIYSYKASRAYAALKEIAEYNPSCGLHISISLPRSKDLYYALVNHKLWSEKIFTGRKNNYYCRNAEIGDKYSKINMDTDMGTTRLGDISPTRWEFRVFSPELSTYEFDNVMDTLGKLHLTIWDNICYDREMDYIIDKAKTVLDRAYDLYVVPNLPYVEPIMNLPEVPSLTPIEEEIMPALLAEVYELAPVNVPEPRVLDFRVGYGQSMNHVGYRPMTYFDPSELVTSF